MANVFWNNYAGDGDGTNSSSTGVPPYYMYMGSNQSNSSSNAVWYDELALMANISARKKVTDRFTYAIKIGGTDGNPLDSSVNTVLMTGEVFDSHYMVVSTTMMRNVTSVDNYTNAIQALLSDLHESIDIVLKSVKLLEDYVQDQFAENRNIDGLGDYKIVLKAISFDNYYSTCLVEAKAVDVSSGKLVAEDSARFAITDFKYSKSLQPMLKNISSYTTDKFLGTTTIIPKPKSCTDWQFLGNEEGYTPTETPTISKDPMYSIDTESGKAITLRHEAIDKYNEKDIEDVFAPKESGKQFLKNRINASFWYKSDLPSIADLLHKNKTPMEKLRTKIRGWVKQNLPKDWRDA